MSDNKLADDAQKLIAPFEEASGRFHKCEPKSEPCPRTCPMTKPDGARRRPMVNWSTNERSRQSTAPTPWMRSAQIANCVTHINRTTLGLPPVQQADELEAMCMVLDRVAQSAALFGGAHKCGQLAQHIRTGQCSTTIVPFSRRRHKSPVEPLRVWVESDWKQDDQDHQDHDLEMADSLVQCGKVAVKLGGRNLIKLNFKSLLLIVLTMTRATSDINATKCYQCLFQLARCTNPLDCYNQPDTCSNTNFSPLYSPTLECEFGCEQYVITDATGSIVVWRRDCATEKSPKSSYVCFSRNIYFLRHDQCWCHTDYCNSSTNFVPNTLMIATLSLLITGFSLMKFSAYCIKLN